MGLRSCCTSCCSCCTCLLFVFFLGAIKTRSPWAFLTDLPGCNHEPLPGNETGLKVLIGGPGKSGTKTLSYFLTQLGVRTYHSHDYAYLAFEEFITQEWERRGATFFEWPSIGSITYSMTREAADSMANAMSKCRPDGMAFDGMEGTYEWMVERSPGVKVIMMERPFSEWFKSFECFLVPMKLTTLHDFLLCASLNSLLPWGVFIRLIDPLVGSPAAKTLQDGFPLPTDTMPPMTFIHYQMVNHRRHMAFWMVNPISSFITHLEEEYKKMLATMRNAVPSERVLEFDFKKHTAEDLCEFLEISPCPRSGKIPRQANSFPLTQDNPICGGVAMTVGLFYYWVTWRFLGGIWGLLWSPKSQGIAEKKDK